MSPIERMEVLHIRDNLLDDMMREYLGRHFSIIEDLELYNNSAKIMDLSDFLPESDIAESRKRVNLFKEYAANSQVSTYDIMSCMIYDNVLEHGIYLIEVYW